MEVADSRETVSVGPSVAAEPAVAKANGGPNHLFDDSLLDDDDRSSSLSEIDDVLDEEPSDYEFTKPDRPAPDAPENDSEAETERIEESPNNLRIRRDIVVSASGHGVSPSKLAQSTTYEDLNDEDDDEQLAGDTPSKPRRSSNNTAAAATSNGVDESHAGEDSALSDAFGKKRKRFESGDDDTGTDVADEEPLRKRRISIQSDLSDPLPDDLPLSPAPMDDDPVKTLDDDTPVVEDTPDLELTSSLGKGKRARKTTRKGRRTRETDEDTETGGVDAGSGLAGDDALDDDEQVDRDEADEAETGGKAEEESAKKMSAMESLAVLEKEFATLRDKIYDERIAKLNREMEMLQGPNPTHPELLRQLETIQRYRDAKIHYEQQLYRYRIQALMNKSLAERAQIHSGYFQKARDVREKYSSAVSQQFYAIQHDRFKSDELSPSHSIPFPTRRSQQIAHQTAYNQEVSVMAGVAKYVGFPAAPTLSAARPSELEEDFEKMGISFETRQPAAQHPSTLPRGAMSAMSSGLSRTAAEEAFLEQTPWANPQHPFHQQQAQHQHQHQHRPPQQPHRIFEPTSHTHAATFTTPAAQKRVVDVNAPNGSASTIPEHPSAANSSTNNTPYGMEQEPRHQGLANLAHPDYDADRRKSGFRSLSSSPLDVRKQRPPPPPGGQPNNTQSQSQSQSQSSNYSFDQKSAVINDNTETRVVENAARHKNNLLGSPPATTTTTNARFGGLFSGSGGLSSSAGPNRDRDRDRIRDRNSSPPMQLSVSLPGKSVGTSHHHQANRVAAAGSGGGGGGAVKAGSGSGTGTGLGLGGR